MASAKDENDEEAGEGLSGAAAGREGTEEEAVSYTRARASAAGRKIKISVNKRRS